MRGWMGAVQKETPTGGEIRWALLISIGNLGGGVAANPVGGRWEEEIVARLMMCI